MSALPIKPPLWLLVLVTLSGTLAMHMFVPALPSAALSLGASVAAMQTTVSIYMLGLAGGQLLYGPFSDAYGRRPMLMLGLAVYAAAGLVAACSPDVHTLLVARLFQALGGCAGLALGRAIVRDMAQPQEAVRDLALLNLMMMVGPGLAPLLGSGLSAIWGWRSIFALLSGMGVVTLALTWRHLPETAHPTGVIRMGTIARDYARLLRSPGFMGFALGGGCATTSLYAFIAAAPFIITNELHRSIHEVGYYLGAMAIGMAVGNAFTRHMSHTWRVDRLLLMANLLSLVGAVLLLASVQLGLMTTWSEAGLMLLLTLGAGAASPAALSMALGAAPADAIGSAAGLYGFMQMLVGASCTLALGVFADPALGSASVLTVAMLLSQVAIGFATRRTAA